MDVKQFDTLIVVPTLTAIGLLSPAARTLMLGTAILESNLEYLRQFGNGPGLGVYQIEEPTYKDIYRYLNLPKNSQRKENCLVSAFYIAWPPREALIHNLRWCTIMARIKYEMIPEPLPGPTDAYRLAEYYKIHYNSSLGKANIEIAATVFEKVISEIVA